jgi:hypothetical protein
MISRNLGFKMSNNDNELKKLKPKDIVSRRKAFIRAKRPNPIVSLPSALSNKISRASYYIMRDQVPFDEDKLFG